MSADEPPIEGKERVNRLAQIRLSLWIVLGLMAVQGALGIYVNLFGNLSAPSDPNAVFPIVFGSPVLAAHFLNAFALIGLTAFLLVRAGGVQIPGLRAWSGLLLASFVAAAYSGYHFTGTQENIYSFSMEMGFLVALVLVAVLIYRTGVTIATARVLAPAGA